MAKILLARDDVNTDIPDNEGTTPLSWAARNGHEGVVKILLERDHVNPEIPDNEGITPLSWAAYKGHEGVVEILLGREVNPDKPDSKGRTPLWIVASEGHEGVVEMLLARDDVNPDEPNISGRAPLWWATRNGHEGVVKILLAWDDVSPHKPDKCGETPLFWAVKNEHKGLMALLEPPESATPTYRRGQESSPPHRLQMRITRVPSQRGSLQLHITSITAIVSPLSPPPNLSHGSSPHLTLISILSFPPEYTYDKTSSLILPFRSMRSSTRIFFYVAKSAFINLYLQSGIQSWWGIFLLY